MVGRGSIGIGNPDTIVVRVVVFVKPCVPMVGDQGEAFDNAPIAEPETEEERRPAAEARARRAREERAYSAAEIKAVIAEMRRKQEGG